MAVDKNPWPSNIARQAVLEFQAYAARGGATNALHLDANESPWSPPPVENTGEFNRYPAQQPAGLRARLAGLYGVNPGEIMIGRGADEAIEVLLRTFCEAGQDSILICPPTFGYFATCAAIQGAGIVTAPLRADFSYDGDLIKDKIRETGPSLKIAFLCSPNNPTGNVIEPHIVAELCTDFPQTLIVIDEAYIEFAGQESFANRLGQFPNLVVLRTLSKAYALAGVRAGVAIAGEPVIDLMLKVLPPYPVPCPVEQAVMAALAPAAMPVHMARLKLWKSERSRMADALKSSPFVEKIYPSEANFLLLDIKDDAKLLRELAKYQVKTRDFRKTLPGKMRLSIGKPAQNDIALAAFGVAVKPQRPQRIGEAHRTTGETDISVWVNLDDAHGTQINTGIGFYDHMLAAMAKHGGFGLVLTCEGDLEIDAHHTIEDCALALGTALANALGDKAGAGRFGSFIPMDETLAKVVVDLSGRAAMVFKGTFPAEMAGEFPAEMCPHFFESLAQTLGAAIHIEVNGNNTHHMIEACFKGLGRALAPAFRRDGTDIASTKGVL